jgi:transposase-like protein
MQTRTYIHGICPEICNRQIPRKIGRYLNGQNPLERILREIRRRTRVVGAFPDGQSALNPCRGQAAPNRRHGVVDQEISEHWAAEGPADEMSRHPLSQ